MNTAKPQNCETVTLQDNPFGRFDQKRNTKSKNSALDDAGE